MNPRGEPIRGTNRPGEPPTRETPEVSDDPVVREFFARLLVLARWVRTEADHSTACCIRTITGGPGRACSCGLEVARDVAVELEDLVTENRDRLQSRSGSE